jgi:ATP-dependent DNA helicase RecG
MYDDENVVVEYKSREIEPWKIAKEIVAFSNSKGGKLIFGIDDRGNVVGIESPKKLEETIANISRNNCEPPIVPEIERQSKKGKTIIVVKVPKGNDRPYKTGGKFYIRVGSTVREASRTGFFIGQPCKKRL